LQANKQKKKLPDLGSVGIPLAFLEKKGETQYYSYKAICPTILAPCHGAMEVFGPFGTPEKSAGILTGIS